MPKGCSHQDQLDFLPSRLQGVGLVYLILISCTQATYSRPKHAALDLLQKEAMQLGLSQDPAWRRHLYFDPLFLGHNRWA
jgi:hypothetical protein